MPAKPKHFYTFALIASLLPFIGVTIPCLASGNSLITGIFEDHPPHSWMEPDHQPQGNGIQTQPFRCD